MAIPRVDERLRIPTAETNIIYLARKCMFQAYGLIKFVYNSE